MLDSRLLAADVLLARLERQDESAAALRVLRGADDPARHFADMLFPRRHESEVRAAERERQAEALAFAGDDVGAHRAGRLQQPERERVDREHGERADLVRRLDEVGQVVQAAEEVRVLHEHGGRRCRSASSRTRRGRRRRAAIGISSYSIDRFRV